MKKTSVHLDEAYLEQLKRCAQREGQSEAEVLRRAILRHAQEADYPRRLALDGIAEGPGGSVADFPEGELLAGFGPAGSSSSCPVVARAREHHLRPVGRPFTQGVQLDRSR